MGVWGGVGGVWGRCVGCVCGVGSIARLSFSLQRQCCLPTIEERFLSMIKTEPTAHVRVIKQKSILLGHTKLVSTMLKREAKMGLRSGGPGVGEARTCCQGQSRVEGKESLELFARSVMTLLPAIPPLLHSHPPHNQLSLPLTLFM